MGPGNGPRVQFSMRHRHRAISEAIVEIDRDSTGELSAEFTRWGPVIALPATLADEGWRDQNDRAKLALWRIRGESVDQECPTERVPNENGAILQGRELIRKHRRPCGVARIIFIGHTWIADLVTRPQLDPEARDELVVPLIMDTLASALDEEHLPFHLHGSMSC